MASHYDIVICGGGLVGLMLANLLDTNKFQVALLDAGRVPGNSEPVATQRSGAELTSGFAPRVSVLNSRSVAMLERCGVVLGRHAVFSEMAIFDGEGTAQLEFNAAEIGAEKLGIVVENHLVVQGLYERLKASTHVDLKFGSAVAELETDELGNRIVLQDGEEITADLVVGADGGNSKVRELTGIRTAGWSYDETALVTTIETELPHNATPRQWFTKQGPLAFLPLSDQNLCSIVWSHPDADALCSLSADEFCELLSEASEDHLGRVMATDRRFSFPLKQQHAYQYTRKGVVLIGDAAHTIHPLAGQGANLGLADAEVLSRELLQTVLNGESPGDIAVLRRFSRERQPQNLAMGAAMETFKRVYGTSIPALGWLRNEGMRLVNRQSPIKSLVMRFAAGRL